MACGKRRYNTWSEALRVLLGATHRRGTPLRIYPCPTCSGFHLTKRPANPTPPTVPGPFTPADLARKINRQEPA